MNDDSSNTKSKYRVFREELFREIPAQPGIRPDLGEPSFSDYRLDSEAVIESLYEPLRAAHPELISRELIGLDTSGAHEMWLYDFHPENPRATVYLQSGVHPIETEGVFGLAEILRLIVAGELPELADVRFIVIPIVSVFGAHERSLADNIVQNYALKHNMLGINSNRDCKNQKLSETRNVFAALEKYRDVIDLGFDLHTTTEPGWGDYMTVYPDELPSRELVVETNAFLRERNIKGRPSRVKYVGPSSTYPLNASLGDISEGYSDSIYECFGIPVCTLEHSDFSFSDKLGTSDAITRAVEMYVNHIIQAIEFYIR